MLKKGQSLAIAVILQFVACTSESSAQSNQDAKSHKSEVNQLLFEEDLIDCSNQLRKDRGIFITDWAIWRRNLADALTYQVEQSVNKLIKSPVSMACDVSFLVTRSGEIKDIYVEHTKNGFTFQGIVFSSINSLKNHRYLQFPDGSDDESHTFKSEIIYKPPLPKPHPNYSIRADFTSRKKNDLQRFLRGETESYSGYDAK